MLPKISCPVLLLLILLLLLVLQPHTLSSSSVLVESMRRNTCSEMASRMVTGWPEAASRNADEGDCSHLTHMLEEMGQRHPGFEHYARTKGSLLARRSHMGVLAAQASTVFPHHDS